MSLRDEWKKAGKGIGKSFAGVGKNIVKSVAVGAEIAASDDNDGKKEGHLRDGWSEVGHSFGEAGKAFGQAAAGTARKVAGSVDPSYTDDNDGDKDSTIDVDYTETEE